MSKKSTADKIRLESNKRRYQEQQKQNELIAKTLSGISSNKVIKFDDDDEEERDEPPNKILATMSLFDDDNEDDIDTDSGFQIREQFEGASGSKLLELQSRYNTDERFRLDKRFAESDEEPEENTPKKPKKEKPSIPTIVRFDPKVDKVETENVKSKKVKEKKKENTEEEVIELPEVSDERYFQVNKNLLFKDKTTTGFSLRDMFKSDDDKNIEQKTNGRSDSKNDDDTSDNYETEEEEIITENAVDNKKDQSNNEPVYSTQAFSSSKLFYEDDDPRYQEGIDFFNADHSINDEDFKQLRREIILTVKQKLRKTENKKTQKKKIQKK